MGLELDAKRGVSNSYGPRNTNEKFGGVTAQDVEKVAEYIVNFNDLPGLTTPSGMALQLPPYAKILSARFEVITAFTSTSTTTTLAVGTAKVSDSTSVSAAGVIAGTQLTAANIGTRGNLVTSTGTLIGASVGVDAVKLYMTSSANDLLTGKGRIILRYTKEGV